MKDLFVFKSIAESASLSAWQTSSSFCMIVEKLREWFPIIPPFESEKT